MQNLSFIKSNQLGFLLNEASEENIENPWDIAVSEAKLTLLQQFGTLIRSIYVQGSVARGEAVQGSSDLDIIAIVNDSLSEPYTSFASALSKELTARYPFMTKLDLLLVPYKDLFKSRRALMTKFVIKTQGVCIYGEDIAPFIRPYKADSRTIFQLFMIKKDIITAIKNIKASKTQAETDHWCRWIMRKLLRTGFELVLLREKKYPLGLYTCYKIFSNYYPERESEMRTTLTYAISPPIKQKIARHLNQFAPWMIREAERKKHL